MRKTVYAFLVSLPVAAAACESGPGSLQSGDSSPVAQKDFPVTLADAYCGALGTCCTGASLPFDGASCRQKMEGLLHASLGQIAPGGARYDESAAGLCVQRARAQANGCRLGAEGLDDACERVLTGTKAVGAPCASSVECARTADGRRVSCTSLGSSSPDTSGRGEKKCQDLSSAPDETRHGVEGETCRATCSSTGGPASGSTTCVGVPSETSPAATTCYAEDGLYCHTESKTCRPALGAGEKCMTGMDCAAALHCAAGRCEAKKAIGAACNLGDHECVTSAYCDVGIRQCAAKRELGEPCTDDRACASTSCRSGACVDPTALATPSRCALRDLD